MNVVIIDNEQNIREGLKELLSTFCPEVTLLAEADGVASGYDCIRQHQPELIFLDVEMDDGTGMDLLARIENPDFDVIFVTAHDKYAINAFRYAAIDFLLKPVDPEELMRAVERAGEKKKVSRLNEQIEVLRQRFATPASSKKIVLKDAESVHLIQVEDVLALEADGSYTRFHLADGREIMVSKNLKEYESLLVEHRFFRTHHSFMANLNRVSRFDKRDGGLLVMDTGMQVPVSFRKKDAMLEELARL